MPTGYTAAVATGEITELTPFIMQLARGMGALYSMRDMPAGAPIPEKFEPSSYHRDALVELRTERSYLAALTVYAAQQEAHKAVREWGVAREKAHAERTEQRARYLRMIDRVEAWEGAPEGIKEFALQQLQESMQFDCPLPFKYYTPRPEADGSVWRQQRLEKLREDIDYHEKEWAKELERTEDRNRWLTTLRSSLEGQG